jgi:putative flippase GtrA
VFGVRGREGLFRQHAAGALVYVLALALTQGALEFLRALDARPPRALEAATLIIAGVLATSSRYVALRTWVFTRRRRGPALLRPSSSSTLTK